MLWRLAFPLLTLVFGVFIGVTLGNYFARSDLDNLRNSNEIVTERFAQSEARWLEERGSFLRDQDAARLKLSQAKNQVFELESSNGQAFAAVDSLRSQVAMCRNDLNVALREMETLRAELDTLEQSSTIVGQ